VRIHVVTPDDPLSARVHEESVATIIVGKTMEIDLILPSSDPEAREAIQTLHRLGLRTVMLTFLVFQFLPIVTMYFLPETGPGRARYEIETAAAS